MNTQSAILLHLLEHRQSQTIGQCAAWLDCSWNDARRAVTILLNRGMILESGESSGVDAVPSYALTSAGQLEARSLRAAKRMEESSDDDES